MRRGRRIRGAMLMTAVLVPAVVAQQPRDNRGPSLVGTAALSGTVSDHTQRPLRRARVTLNGSELEIMRTTITSDDGAFTFEGLPGGRYSVSAHKDGHVSMSFGAKRPGRPGTMVVLSNGRSQKVDLHIPRGSVITGTVLGPGGEPAPDVMVTALISRYDTAVGERQLTSAPNSTVTTDNRGVYRIFGLAAGTYVVAAVPRLPFQFIGPHIEVLSEAEVRTALAEVQERRTAARPGMPVPAQATPGGHAERKTVGLAPIFYPGTSLQERALPLTIGVGEVRNAVNFDLEYVPTADVEGIVTVPTGMRVQLHLINADGMAPDRMTRMSVSPGEDGRFRFGRIAPGSYTLTARAFPADVRLAATPAETRLWAETTVVVSGDDIAGITLPLQPALTISGRVTFESTAGPSPELGLLRVPLPTGSVGGNPVSLPGVLIEGNRFTISNVVPGRYRFMSPPRGLRAPVGRWWLKSIVLNGKEMLDVELDLRQSTDEGSITFSDRASELSGVVRLADGRPAADGYVVVFAEQKSAWFHGSRRVAGMRPAADGRYVVRNLPPGDYLIAASSDLEFNEWFDPEVLQTLAAGAARISLSEYEQKVQDVIGIR